MKNEIKKRQEELRKWITKIGMTQKYFIGQYCIENFANYHDEEIDQYYEKFKKELSRKTTKVEVLDKYFKFLYSLEEFRNVGYIKPVYIEDDEFGSSFNQRMKKISTDISNRLIKTDTSIG